MSRIFTFRSYEDSVSSLQAIAFLSLCGIATVGAWLTHLIWVVKTLASPVGITVGQMILSIVGTVFFPIGIVHGWIIWFS